MEPQEEPKKKFAVRRLRDFLAEFIQGSETPRPSDAASKLPPNLYSFNDSYFKKVYRLFSPLPAATQACPDEEHDGKGGKETSRREGNGQESGRPGEGTSFSDQ